MTFEQIWESAQYNEFFWLSHAASLGGVTLLGLAALLIRNRIARWFSYAVLALLIVLPVTNLTVRSIQSKWETRRSAATTDEQIQAVTDGDGANLAFAPIIGAFKATLYCGVGTLVILLVRRSKSGKRPESIDEPWHPPVGRKRFVQN